MVGTAVRCNHERQYKGRISMWRRGVATKFDCDLSIYVRIGIR